MRNIIKFMKAFKKNFTVFAGLAVLFTFPAFITGMATKVAIGFVIACFIMNCFVAFVTMRGEK